MVFAAIAVVIAAYFIGSVNFAVIFAKAFLKKDVRNLGSGNAGATNVMRTAGFLPGILTFVCDALKGFLASYLGRLVFGLVISSGIDWLDPIYGAYLCGVACMLGHVFPIFFQFKGGKGAAISVGIYAVCCPLAIILGLCAFANCTAYNQNCIARLTCRSAYGGCAFNRFFCGRGQYICCGGFEHNNGHYCFCEA